jgi:glycosyltransferase involved in cell wall biosynthesis
LEQTIKHSPFFSIIIPTFNREIIIEETINSCLQQNFEDYEIIVIDDCSTDATSEKVSEINDSRIRLVKNDQNLERCISRNKGIDLANGKYICFLDSDDLFCENHLSTFYNYLESVSFPDCMLFTNSFLKFEENELEKKIVPEFNSHERFSYLLKYTPNPARVCVSTNILRELNFDSKIPGIEDLDLWLRIAINHTIYHLEEYTSIYRIHSEMYSVQSAKRYRKELEMFNYVANKAEFKNALPIKEVNRLKSMCYFFLCQYAFQDSKKFETITCGLKSFFLYPQGYNGKTNKIIFTNITYSIPLLGNLFKFLYRKWKK